MRFEDFKALTFDLKILRSLILRSKIRNKKRYVYIMYIAKIYIAKMIGEMIFGQMFCTPVLFETVKNFCTPNIQCAKCFMPQSIIRKMFRTLIEVHPTGCTG